LPPSSGSKSTLRNQQEASRANRPRKIDCDPDLRRSPEIINRRREEGSSTFLINVSEHLPDYTASHPRNIILLKVIGFCGTTIRSISFS
jgi:hypothetical protein